MSDLRVVFMGTPAFVVPVLKSVEKIVEEIGGRVVAVYSGPDRPAGRGRKLAASPVKGYAVERGFDVLTPGKVTTEEEKVRFESLGADLVVLAAYGLLLPRPFLFSPLHGAVNVHPSLLPRHRGAAPVPAAILAGDSVSGTTIIKMDEGLDTGPVLAMREVPLTGKERASELTMRLFDLGARMLEECLPSYMGGELVPIAQASEGASVIKRFAKEDGSLDWTRPTAELERRVRALDPWPGTATTWQGQRIDVLEASMGDSAGASPGQVIMQGDAVAVGTGDGTLVLERVRPAGRNAMAARDFVRGRADFIGAVLPS
ncbi:MAG: methionyl-tRNA formyltransferase [Chloroflexi bacterium]|nr:methionyl-tRNA formyltransferase [Chloroflexota bacterium]